jgi:5-methylcytosine-specific restriction endonuclease McrA
VKKLVFNIPRAADHQCPECGELTCGCDCDPRAYTPEHVASADCWCEPTIDYRDPETGVAVYVHKEIQ